MQISSRSCLPFLFVSGKFFHINPNKGLVMKTVDTFAFYIFGFFSLLASANSMYYIYNPWAVKRFGNLFSRNTSWILLQLLNLPEVLGTFVRHMNICVPLVFVFYCRAVLMRILLPEFRLGQPGSKYLAHDSFRQPSNFTIMYRSCQIIFMISNQLFGKCLVPVQAFSTLLFVFCNYTLIRHCDMLAPSAQIIMIIWAVFTPMFWALVLVVGGYVHSIGLKNLRSWEQCSWNSARDAKIMKKFALSCQPLKICFGSMFVIRRVSLMVFVKGVTRSLMRALLTLETN